MVQRVEHSNLFMHVLNEEVVGLLGSMSVIGCLGKFLTALVILIEFGGLILNLLNAKV